jgi:hypothetical protein
VLQNGGTVSNGSNSDKTAKIVGGRNGVYIAGFLPSTVSNFGTIDASGGRNGINLYLGGNITNGSSVDTTALITGGNHGVYVGGPSTINNFGTITSGTKAALAFLDGGTVINGSTSDTVARIASGATTGNRAGIYDLVGQTTIMNFGTVTSPSGGAVDLYKGGGVVTNGSTGDKSALLQGSTGASAVQIGGFPATVTNFGTINGGSGINANGPITVRNLGRITAGAFSAVGLNNGGNVINGSTANATASLIGAPGTSGDGVFEASGSLTVANYAIISGGAQGIHAGGVATIHNFGSITSGTFAAVQMMGGGTLVNGSATDKTAKIAFLGTASQSAIDSLSAASTITNFGLISGVGGINANAALAATNFGTISAGRYSAIGLFGPSGNIINGSTANTTASLIGAPGTSGNGIFESSGTLAVVNYGTVSGGSLGINSGSATATITNFGLINGATGVLANAPITAKNFGRITSGTFSAISLNDGGNVINGSTANTTASLIGAAGTSGSGIFVSAGPLSATNYGTIAGGSAGINAHGATTIGNFGTITSSIFSAVNLTAGGIVTNGDASHKSALIAGPSGNTGIFASTGIVTVTNAGTIDGGSGLFFTNGTTSATATVTNAGSIISASGTAGTAIGFGSGNDRLIVDPGAVFVGKVFGGAGSNVLEMASGASVGTISGIGSQFSGFQTAVVDASAAWNISGANNIASFTNNGTVGFQTAGTLAVTTAIGAASSGVFLLENSGVLEVAADKGHGNQMQFVSPSELIVDTAANFGTNVGSTLYTGPLIESFGTGDSILLKNIAAAGASLNYSTATGLLQVTGSGIATLHFDNASLGAGSFHHAADGSGHLIITHS